MKQYKFESELTFSDILAHGIIWILLTLVTFGLAIFVFPYYLQRLVISRSAVYDETGRRCGHLVCTLDFPTILVSTLIWAVISVITFGVGYYLFLYRMQILCMNHTRVVEQPAPTIVVPAS